MHLAAFQTSNFFCRIVPAAALSTLVFLSQHAAIGQDNLPKSACSYGRTNSDCYILIDRDDPVSPTTMQLYTGSQVAIVLINPRIYENYTLDPVYPPAQSANSNDVGNTLLTGIFQNIQKFGGAEQAFVGLDIINQTASACPSTLAIGSGNLVDDCFKSLEMTALSIYKSLIQCETPDAIGLDPQSSAAAECTNLVDTYDVTGVSGLAGDIQSFLGGESNLSGAINAYSKQTTPKPDSGLSAKLTMKIKDYDALAQDLNAYNKRLSDLKAGHQVFPPLCSSALSAKIKAKAGCSDTKPNYLPNYLIVKATKDNAIYGPSVSRPASFQLNALNLVTNAQAASIDTTKKKAIALVNLNFADSGRWFGANTFRWEGSAGIFFSAIPDRSFTVSTLYFENDPSTTDPTNCPAASTKNPVGTVCDNIVTQRILRPSIVPFTALHYRISPDAKFIPWKTALYMTGAVGYNVNTTSADFAGGLSITWRSIMISPLWHFGHDIELTNGLYVNESLGANFKGNVTTQDYWRNMLAVGVSLRVSALTGR